MKCTCCTERQSYSLLAHHIRDRIASALDIRRCVELPHDLFPPSQIQSCVHEMSAQKSGSSVSAQVHYILSSLLA